MAAAAALTLLSQHKDKIAGVAGLGAIVLLGVRLIRSAPKGKPGPASPSVQCQWQLQ